MNDNQTFKPENQTIDDIFSCSAIYVIPNYQRQYTWGNEQLDELWNDLYESYKNNKNDCYFLGSIVVVDNGKGKHELVDGQQRITTLMIMLNVLYRTFPDLNENSDEILKGNITKIKNLVFFNEERNRLQLQTDPNYDTIFKKTIINAGDFSGYKYPTISEMKKDEPEYKYINAAKFFYDKFMTLLNENGKEDLDNFVNYILFQTNIIKIVCYDQSFAIKLFLVLNDRGMELSVSDIVKSYILDRLDEKEYSQDDKEVFNANWKSIEQICTDNDIKINDFMVYYEYYRLKSNPKKQVTDELKKIIYDEKDIRNLVYDLKVFADNLNSVYTSNNPTIYSLRYIPWRFYVVSALVSAFQVDYPEKESLYELMRKFFYVSWIAGKTLNGIKQTSFKLIEYIVEKKNIEDIEELINDFIYRNRLIKYCYEVFDDDVFGEKFLKPLLLSVEYKIREDTNKTFYYIDNNLHVDHVLPQRFYKKMDEWKNIENIEEAKKYIHKLGNMALLQSTKNEEALNFGFAKKIDIYSGKDEKETGYTAFDTTKKIIDNYYKNNNWGISEINERKNYLMNEIEDLLDISREESNIEYIEEITSKKHKWKYKGKTFTNKGLVHEIIKDYIEQNNIVSFYDIPKEIREFKMFHHELLKSEKDDKYDYKKIDNSNFELFGRNICQTNDTNDFLGLIRKYYDFELEKINQNKQD